eukprot:14485766-Alexandrium_andersonii.AAC.1
MGFVYADFDGCMYGLRPVDPKHSDKFIRKPWRIACLNSSLPKLLHRMCNHQHRHHPCEGRGTILTQGHTRAICSMISQSIVADTGPARSSSPASCVHVSLTQPQASDSAPPSAPACACACALG